MALRNLENICQRRMFYKLMHSTEFTMAVIRKTVFEKREKRIKRICVPKINISSRINEFVFVGGVLKFNWKLCFCSFLFLFLNFFFKDHIFHLFINNAKVQFYCIEIFTKYSKRCHKASIELIGLIYWLAVLYISSLIR